MFGYILKRFWMGLVTLLVLVTITFFLMHAIPGNPFTSEKGMSPQVKANLMAKYHLDKPLWQQYLYYLGGLVKGDLGTSFKYESKTVNQIIAQGSTVSAKLGLVSIIISLLVGIPLGIISALKRGKWQDGVAMIFSTIGVSVPSFVLAILMMYFFGVKLKLVHITGLETPSQYILPATALALYSIAFIARLTRSSMLEVLRMDYIRTAKAKGLSEFTVIFKHALKNALMPVLTYLGPMVAGVLTGSFVIEQIFTIPGIGRDFVTSISSRDYTTILGMTIFFGALLIFMNLIVDIMYGVIDPRVKLES